MPRIRTMGRSSVLFFCAASPPYCSAIGDMGGHFLKSKKDWTPCAAYVIQRGTMGSRYSNVRTSVHPLVPPRLPQDLSQGRTSEPVPATQSGARPHRAFRKCRSVIALRSSVEIGRRTGGAPSKKPV